MCKIFPFGVGRDWIRARFGLSCLSLAHRCFSKPQVATFRRSQHARSLVWHLPRTGIFCTFAFDFRQDAFDAAIASLQLIQLVVFSAQKRQNRRFGAGGVGAVGSCIAGGNLRPGVLRAMLVEIASNGCASLSLRLANCPVSFICAFSPRISDKIFLRRVRSGRSWACRRGAQGTPEPWHAGTTPGRAWRAGARGAACLGP
mgnify:CR=1 FL=1